MRIAVEGCSHGCLDQIYASILALDRRDGQRTTLLILCGDVQTLRNASDMHCLAVPDKYKQMGDFHRYYSGERRAPILTLMVGGNHEASNYLWELFYGGWVAPNIYYLGAAGCVDVGGLTISGISGIYKSHDFSLGRFERMPYNAGSVRSIYHTRMFDTFRLELLARMQARSGRKTTIAVSHDWPNTIEQHGDVAWLTWKKAFFKHEIDSLCLGSPPLMEVLRVLQPSYWFAAHLHVRFAALVKHSGEGNKVVKNNKQTVLDRKQQSDTVAENPDEIDVSVDDDEDDDGQEQALQTASELRETRFLALSKCLEGQDFLQIVDVPAPYDDNKDFQDDEEGQPSLHFHPLWLAVLRSSQPFFTLERTQVKLPDVNDESFIANVQSELRWLEENSLRTGTAVKSVQTFVPTAPSTLDLNGVNPGPPPSWYTNPQTVALCDYVGIPNQINPPPPLFPNGQGHPRLLNADANAEEEEIRRIEEAAKVAMDRRKNSDPINEHAEEINVTLSEDDEEFARWKEGAG